MKRSYLIIMLALILVGCEPNGPEFKELTGIGKFSIAEDKQVTFSPGALQYHRTTNTWHFAQEQWEMLGLSNLGSPAYIPSVGHWASTTESLGSKIDLFGWGTGNNPTNTSREVSDYAEYYEWGYNIIDGDRSKKWRTLHIDEWKYLLYERKNAEELIYFIQLGGLPGTLLLPDDWVKPAEVNFDYREPEGETIIPISLPNCSLEDWRKMEANGAVFMPKTFMRYSSYAVRSSTWYAGEYWVASHSGDQTGVVISFGFDGKPFKDQNRSCGHSVRLVKDL